MTHAPHEVGQVTDAIRRSFPLADLALPDEFFPAHLPVALIDAVFRSGLRHGEAPEPAAERYCRRFGLARVRADGRNDDPARGEEETLARLVERYQAMGTRAMAAEVFRTRRLFAGSRIARAECVLRAARALRRIGVERLSDVTARRRTAIEDVLGTEPWAREATVRLFLMYTGGEGFVHGDAPVRAFVAQATGRETIPARQAVRLVREAAWELILAPRYVDHVIWRCRACTCPHPGAGHG